MTLKFLSQVTFGDLYDVSGPQGHRGSTYPWGNFWTVLPKMGVGKRGELLRSPPTHLSTRSTL